MITASKRRLLEPSRRSFIAAAGGLVASSAIVRASSLFELLGVGAATSSSSPVAWDPATVAGFNADLIFSNGNRTASNPAAAASSQFTRAITGADKNNTGKWYLEFITDAAAGDGRQQLYGIVDATGLNFALIQPSNIIPGTGGGTVTWNDTAGAITRGNGNVVGWAIDFDNKKAFVALNNTFGGTQNVGTGANPDFSWSSLTANCYCQLGLDSAIGTETCTIAGNSGNQTFAPPSGYTRWDGF